MDEAFWNSTASPADYAPLAGRVDAEVAVIGGGIVGLTAAERLVREGRQVVVIEAQRVGAQVTGRSTAKLTALHGLIYAYLTQKHGEDAARRYATVNQEALGYVRERSEALSIDCRLEPAVACSFSSRGHSLAAIREEVSAAKRAGLAVEFVDDVGLPFSTAGGIRLDGQWQFHPKRYVDGLAGAVVNAGGAIYEGTRALRVEEGRPHRVLTDCGTVQAERVIIATNLPFLDRGLFFSRAFPYAHVVLAARIAEASVPPGMFLDMDEPTFSVRAYRDEQGPVLIATGPGFRPGHGDVAARYRELEDWVRERFEVHEVLQRWSNEDYYAMDRLPFVGPTSNGSSDILVATGFSGWGLSNGTVAGNLLADRILDRPNMAESLFDARRWNFRAGGSKFLHMNLHVGREFIMDRIAARNAPSVDTLGIGEGGLVKHAGKTVAAYRDDDNQLHLFSATCPHLGCLLAWNAADRTWDCPCHGSRFHCTGEMRHGPAVRDMRRL